MSVELVAKICEESFNLDSLQLGQGYYYNSLPLCVVDAVFSIGVKYTSTENVVKRYCDYFKLVRISDSRSISYDHHSISDLIHNIKQMEIRKFAENVFCNCQRTSTRNGILKAEAVLLFAEALEADGIQTFSDLRARGLSVEAESRIKRIPGQSSGISLQYFYMLSGNDDFCKPDRHLIRFFSHCVGSQLNVKQVEKLIVESVNHLRKQHENITMRLLDSAIWSHMSAKKPLPKINGVKGYNKLVRDKIPQIIEQSGKMCVCEILSDEHYIKMLNEKLLEEVNEYLESGTVEELADIGEVMLAILEYKNISLDEYGKIRIEKHEKRGGFKGRIFLKEVYEQE